MSAGQVVPVRPAANSRLTQEFRAGWRGMLGVVSLMVLPAVVVPEATVRGAHNVIDTSVTADSVLDEQRPPDRSVDDVGYFVVTKVGDTADGVCDSDCSLREAIVAANTTPGDDTIELPTGIYQLTLGSLDIEREIGTTAVLGGGRDTTIIDADGTDRVFAVGYHAGLELVGVTVTGGFTQNAVSAHQDGGGIWNWNGTLTVIDSLIEGNVAGENGGGIANTYGTATIENTIIRDNNTDPPDYSTTGSGGGIYNTGTMRIVGSTVEFNASDDGGGIASEPGLVEGYPVTLDIENSTITANTARRGGGLANMSTGIATISDSLISDNHATRYWTGLNSLDRGGGILNWAAELTITRSTIAGNEARATHALDPASGGGGGVANERGVLTVIDTTVSGNQAICDQYLPGDPSLCGRGGGILNAGGYATIVNTTISGNVTDLLNSDHPLYLGGGGGGGLAHMPARTGGSVTTFYCPVTTLDSVTITGNTAAHGGGVDSRWETKAGLLYDVQEWRVGYNASNQPILECPGLDVGNTIVAGNTATFTAGTDDSWGDYTSLGYNLVGVGTGAPSDGPGDVTSADLRLGVLADNGGVTLTHLPSKGSPAIDAGSTSEVLDQRGVARPVGPTDDIGSVEAPQYPNQPPVLDPIGDLVLAEGGVLDVQITASDMDGDTIGFGISGEPGFASLTNNWDDTATLALTPGFDDAGSYPLVAVAVSDGIESDVELFTITVTDTNRMPTADARSATTLQDTAVAITLTGSDPDGDPLDFTISAGPTHGTLSGDAPSVTYTPDTGFVGSDAFTFRVDDGDLISTAAIVSITITAVANHPPVLDPIGNLTVAEGGLSEVPVNASDVDGDTLDLSLTGHPGFASFEDHGDGSGVLTMTPGFDAAGTYPGVTVTVSDDIDTDAETVTITVTPTNRAPIADDQSVTTAEGHPIDVTLTGADPDGDALTISIATQPAHGSLSGSAPDVTYTPNVGYVGADAFTFTASDGDLGSPVATVSITITAVPNAAPVLDAIGDVFVAEGATSNTTIEASDADGDALSFSVSGEPGFARLIDHGNGVATLTLTPGFDDAGTYPGVTISVADQIHTDTETVTITVTPTVPAVPSLESVVPARVLETRLGPGEVTVDHLFEHLGRQPAGSTLELVVAGRGGVPTDAESVMLNLTAVLPAGPGFLTVFPCGSSLPVASHVNYQAGEVAPNAVLAKIGTGGKVCIYTLTETDLIADVNGYVPAGGSPSSVVPARVLETRLGPGEVTVDHLFEHLGRQPAGSTLELVVAGRGGVPTDAEAVMLNLTAVLPSGPGFLTVFPCGSSLPVASHVNYQAGEVAPNAVLAKIGTGGKVCIYTLTETDLIADVNGYVPAGGSPSSVVPARVLETRLGPGEVTVDHLFEHLGRQPAGSTLELVVAGRGGVPTDAESVMLNLTAVLPAGPGFLTVFPCGSSLPVASHVNYQAGEVAPNAVLAKIGTGGKVCIYTLTETDLIADVNGYVP